MIRKLFCSMFVMMVAVSMVAAAEFQGRILEIKDGVAKVQKMKGQGKKAEKDGDPVNLKIGKDAAIIAGKIDMKKVVDGDKIEDGLKNEMFTKISEKGLNATITTEGEGDKEVITKIRVFMKKKTAAE